MNTEFLNHEKYSLKFKSSKSVISDRDMKLIREGILYG